MCFQYKNNECEWWQCMVVYTWASIFMDDSLKLATVAVRWESLIEFMAFCNRNSLGHKRRGVKKLCWSCDCVKNGMILVWTSRVLLYFALHFVRPVLLTMWKIFPLFFFFFSFIHSFILLFDCFSYLLSIMIFIVSISGIFNSFCWYLKFNFGFRNIRFPINKDTLTMKNDVFNNFDTARDFHLNVF